MITIVSALKSEIAPFLEYYSAGNKTALAGGSLYRISGQFHFLRTGVGGAQAAKVLSAYLNSYQPQVLINIGLAGSLNSQIAPGSLFSINEIHSTGRDAIQLPSWPGAELQSASLITVNEAVLSDEGRARLFARFGADLVDMEAYELARIARQHGISFFCFKIVSDDAGEEAEKQFMNNYRVLSGQLFERINPLLQRN